MRRRTVCRRKYRLCGGKRHKLCQHFAWRETRHLLKQGFSTTQTRLLHILSDFYCCPTISNLILATMRVELNKQTRRQSKNLETMSPLLIWIFGGSRIEIITSWLKIYQLSISESWLHNSDSDLEVQFPGYSLFRLDRSGRKVCAFVNSNFKCFQLKELSYITESGFHQL